MKVGQNVKLVAYMGYRDQILDGRERAMYHLYTNRLIALHFRDYRAIECGEKIGAAFRYDSFANAGPRPVYEEESFSEMRLKHRLDVRINSCTHNRFEAHDLGRN